MFSKLAGVLGVLALAIAAVVAVELAQPGAHPRRAAQTTPQMCGLRASSGSYRHVIVVFEENQAYDSIYNSSSAPYINGVIRQCGLATDYHNVTHPSLPNYIAATTGAPLAKLGPFSSDCTPSPTCRWSGSNIFYQLNLRHRLWRGYGESMPGPCGRTNHGYYAARHNPAVYDTDLSNCHTNDLPLGTPSSSPLLKDFSSSTTAPAFATVTPNVCHDMHGDSGCPSNLVGAGDGWLRTWLPKIVSTPVYKAGQTVIFITWDEGERGRRGQACATNTSAAGCHVVTIVVAPSVRPGTRATALFSHYSLLKTSEDLLGLSALGQARSANSMVQPFDL